MATNQKQGFKPHHALAILPIALGVGTQLIKGTANSDSGTKPGVWRWDVKTLADPAASSLNLAAAPTPLKVADADQFAAPDEHLGTSTPRGAGPQESIVYVVDGWARSYKPEADGDYHLLVSDTNDATTTLRLGVEIPTPDFAAAGSVAVPLFQAARTAFESGISHGASGGASYVTLSTPIHVRVTGVGFWDETHGQKGLPSGFELHPVIKLEIDPPAAGHP